MISHQLKDLVPDIFGFPAEPWKLVGVPRIVWFQRPLEALFISQVLLAQTLNLAADKDDLPVAVALPTKLGEFILYRTPGRGNVFKNPTWRSFFTWLEAIKRAPHRLAVRRLIADQQARPIALTTLPYDHRLGPTGTGPITFGHVGGGNFSGTGKPKVSQGGKLPAYCWDPGAPEQKRHFEALRKQFSRIAANDGKRRPIGRPRIIGADKERRALELLAAGWGIKRIAKEIGTGVSFVQRVGGTANRPRN